MNDSKIKVLINKQLKEIKFNLYKKLNIFIILKKMILLIKWKEILLNRKTNLIIRVKKF